MTYPAGTLINKMPTCSFCSVSYADFKSLIIHLKLIHEISLYKCAETDCCRNFSSFHSFRNHLKKIHQEDNNTTPSVIDSVPASKNMKIHKAQLNETCDSESDIFPDNSDYGKASKSFLSNSAFNYMHPQLDTSLLKESIQENTVMLISKFYADKTFTRKHVQIIIESIKNLFEEPINIFQNTLLHVLQNSNVPKEERSLISDQLFCIQNIFTDLHSEYYRLKYLEESTCFVKPIEYIVGERLDNVADGTGLPKVYKSQFIPLQKVLTNFFQLPFVLEKTLHNINMLKSSSVFSNIIQGEFWEFKIEETSDIVLPLFVYFDEFECGNPLGSHAGIHKVGAVYCSVPCIPQVYQARLENIFLCLLFHSSDLKEFGSISIFSKLIDELIFLESTGISVSTNTGSLRIKFSLALILGDNLGLNMLLGFTESFRSNYYCRFCKCSRDEMQQQEVQNDKLMRNINNYESDIEVNNVSLTGIKERCVWNNIPSFHVTKNFAVDIAHDIFEGVAGFDLSEILYRLVIVDKIFSIDTLNHRLKYFDYGKGNINKPPLITNDHLKKKKIKMSFAEMKALVLYAGLLFGNLVPYENKFWYLYIILRQILAIILSKNVSKEKCEALKDLIIKHHSLYKNLFDIPLKPKCHNLVHYPDIMLKIGPLVNISSLRYESKHREFKLCANTVASRVNITKTLAIKQQLNLCYRFLGKKGFQEEVISDEKEETLQNIDLIIPGIDSCSNFSSEIMDTFKKVYLCKSVSFGNTTYLKGDILLTDNTTSLPEFGKVVHILQNNLNDILFVLKRIKVINFHEHLFSYEVVFVDELFYLVFNPSLIHISIVNCVSVGDGRNYITFF